VVADGGDAFWFDNNTNKGLVPHHQIIEQRTSLKPKAQLLRQDCVSSGARLGAVILLALARGITADNHAVQWRTNFLVALTKTGNLPQTKSQRELVRLPKAEPPPIRQSKAG
jgi:hypothetical protein